MFQFRRLASRITTGWYIFNVPGCPIRKSSDITLVCSSPKLIAAYHVLHRLSDPRHSPYALNCFKKIKIYFKWASPLIVTRFTTYYFQYVKELSQHWCWVRRCSDYEPADLKSTSLILKELFLVEDIGVEPMTLCVQGRCSSQLS